MTRHTSMPAPALALALAGLVLGGCPDRWQAPVKDEGSALWLSSTSTALEASAVTRLKQAKIGEVYVTAARFAPRDPAAPLERLELPALPALPVTLAVAGEWESVTGPVDELAEGVAEAARQLRFEVESRGRAPVVGLHFDLHQVDSLARYGEFLTALRAALDRKLFLSASVARSWVGEPELETLAAAVDYLVAFLYGQRVREAEDGKAWDFVEVEAKLALLEQLQTPYLIGVVGLGTASHVSAQGGVKARMTRLSLQEVLWNRDLKLRPGFTLEGVNRRVYAVVAERPTRVGKWRLETGEGVRAVRAATSDVEELTRLVEVWRPDFHLGQVYYRLPGPDERLSLTVENLLNALDPSPATPALELDVAVQRRTGRGYLMRFAIQNRNGEITELSMIDSNYLEARLERGTFGRVQPGDFYRFDLYQAQDDGELERGFRSPDVLRLYLPILEGGQEAASGDVEVKVSGEPEIVLAGRFLLPDGRTLEVGPARWRAGEFVDPPPPAASGTLAEPAPP